jgi:hypothetical protein
MDKNQQKRARVARFAGGVIACGLLGLLAQGGCAESEPITTDIMEPDGGSQVTATGGSGQQGTGGIDGTGGEQATGGVNGTGGILGSGGNKATGGTTGSGGNKATGGTTGSGGNPATGGMTGSGGNPATGGMTGSGGNKATGGTTGTGGNKATGGTTGTGGTMGMGGASGATFTQVYQMILSVSCTGSQCHNPGSQGGFTFSSQSSAYTAIKSRVVAGNANSSSVYTLVNGGRMPPTGKLSSTMINLLASWINAGALNN